MPSPHSPPVAMVLAAGRGTRMGGPKALMSVAGRPWYEHQQSRLSRTGMRCVWTVSETVFRSMRSAGSRFAASTDLVQVDPDAPMFHSVVNGLRRIHADTSQNSPAGVFVLPVDVPAPTAIVWSSLAACAQPAAPRFKGKHGHPVWLPAHTASALLARYPADRPIDPDGRLDRLLERSLMLIDVTDPTIAFNLNMPADLDAWLATQENHGAGRP